MRSIFILVLAVASIILDLQTEAYSENRNNFTLTNEHNAIVKIDNMPVFSEQNNNKRLLSIAKGNLVYVNFTISSDRGTWCAISETAENNLIGYVDCNSLQFEHWHGPDYIEISDSPPYPSENSNVKTARKSSERLRPDIKQNKNWPALLDAAWQGKSDTIRSLIKGGVDVNAKDKESGLTALMAAAAFGNTDVINLLISSGAKINVKDKYGWSAIMIASESGNLNTVKALLKRGANINYKEGNGLTAADLAEIKGHSTIVKLLRRAVGTESKK